MCNKLYVKIKSCCAAGVKRAFLPCGVCEDCRQALKNSWVFRLRVDLEKLTEKGWKIGFLTLTYNDEHLPHIPACLFVDDYSRIPCFKKSDIRTFFIKLKKWLLKYYGCRLDKESGVDTRIRYMVCCEYGESTQRPHYHGIVCFPPNVPPKELFAKIEELWRGKITNDGKSCTGNGWVIPRKFDGWLDSFGVRHNGFLCSSVKAASLYAAKYCCKDLAYLDFIKSVRLRKRRYGYVKGYRYVDDVKVLCNDGDLDSLEVLPAETQHLESYNLKEWKGKPIGDNGLVLVDKLSNYMPFHYQSKSLGLSFLDGLSDAQKLDYLKHGFGFVGEEKLSQLPVYLKNKIIFDPYYVVDKITGKRLVRRKAKQFFCDNLNDIYDLKVKFISDKIKDFQSISFWRSLGADERDIRDVSSFQDFLTCEPDWLASLYISYFGVNREECYDMNLALAWYRRYDVDYVDVTDVPLISELFWQNIHLVFNFFLGLYAKYDKRICDKKQVDNREISRIHDYWSSQI